MDQFFYIVLCINFIVAFFGYHKNVMDVWFHWPWPLTFDYQTSLSVSYTVSPAVVLWRIHVPCWYRGVSTRMGFTWSRIFSCHKQSMTAPSVWEKHWITVILNVSKPEMSVVSQTRYCVWRCLIKTLEIYSKCQICYSVSRRPAVLPRHQSCCVCSSKRLLVAGETSHLVVCV